MNTQRRKRIGISPILLGAAVCVLGACFATDTSAQSEPVIGAHEGMPEGEKTDDLGITVPMAAVDFPARRYPASHEFPTGPEIGERLPEFSLPNQDGDMVNFHEDRGHAKSIVVFYRSVVW